jgi:hypothetical protein
LSTASKVFVVLLAVFSIAFVMLTISHVAQETNWRSLASDYRDSAQNAMANYQAMLASNAAEKLAQNDKVEQLSQSTQILGTQLQETLNELADTQSQLQEVKHQNESNTSSLAKLTGELNIINTEAAELRKQRGTLEKDNLNFQRRNLDLSERNRELTVQVSAMAEQIRHLQQLNFARSDEIRDMQGLGASTASVSPSGKPADSAIRGSIVQVTGDLASVSVGAADRVRVGMRFVIYNDSNYLGDLVITATEPNESVGTLENVQGIVQAGALAVNLAGLASAY